MQNEFPNARNVCYLNTATEGILPQSSLRAIEAEARRKQTPQVLEDEDFFDLPQRCRVLISEIIHCDPSEIALTGSTGFGIGAIALSLPLKAGDEVLLVENDFPANNFSWEPLRSRGIKIRQIPFVSDDHQTDRLLDAIKPETRVISISAVHYYTGLRYDLQAVSNTCVQKGIYLVADAVQMVGAVALDLQKIRIDAISAAGYKWQISPDGTGFLYIRKELIPQLQPFLTRWLRNGDAESFEHVKMFEYDPSPTASRFELAGEPVILLAGYEKSLQLLKNCRIDWIEAHNLKLAGKTKRFFKEAGWNINRSPLPSPIVSVIPPEQYSARSLVSALANREVFVSARQDCLRISPHFYNTDQDIDRLIKEVKALL